MQAANELTERIRQIMADTFGVAEDELPADVTQESYERWSSLYHITLLMALEDHFGRTFSMQQMEQMTSLAAIVDVLEADGVVV